MRNLGILFSAAVLLGIWAYPQMPERMAAHFDAAGAPNGWMGRTEFFILYAVLMLFMTGLFAGLGRVMPLLPPSMLNLPHKAYWLAPERRAHTYRGLSAALYRMGSGTMLFLLLVMGDVFRANMMPEPRTSAFFWPVLVLYLLFIGWESLRMHRRYSRIPSQPS